MSFNQKSSGGTGAGNSGGSGSGIGGLPPNNSQQVAKTLAGIQQQMQNLVHGQNALPQSTQADINALFQQQQRMQNMFKTQQLFQQHFQLQHQQQQHHQQQNKDRNIIGGVSVSSAAATVSSAGEPLALTRPITGTTNAAAAAAAAAELLNKTYQQQQPHQSQHPNGASSTGNVALNQLQQQLQAISPNIIQQIQAIQYQMHQQQQQTPTQPSILPTHTTTLTQQHQMQPPEQLAHHTSSSTQAISQINALPNQQQKSTLPVMAISITPQQQQQQVLTSAVQQFQQTLQQRYLSAAAAAVSASSHSVGTAAVAAASTVVNKLASVTTPTSTAAAASSPTNANQNKFPSVNLSPSTTNNQIAPVSMSAVSNTNTSKDMNKKSTINAAAPSTTTILQPKATTAVALHNIPKHGITGMKIPVTLNTTKSVTSQIFPSSRIDKDQTNNIPLEVSKSAPITPNKLITIETVEKPDESKKDTLLSTSFIDVVVNKTVMLKNDINDVLAVSPDGKTVIDKSVKILEKVQQFADNSTNDNDIANDELKIIDKVSNVSTKDEIKTKCEIVEKSSGKELETNKPNTGQVPEKIEKLKLENDEKTKNIFQSVAIWQEDNNVRSKVEQKTTIPEKVKIIDATATGNKNTMNINLKDTGLKLAAIDMKSRIKEDVTVKQTTSRSSTRVAKTIVDEKETITKPTAITTSLPKKFGRLPTVKTTRENIEDNKTTDIIATNTTVAATTDNLSPIEKQSVVIKKARPRRDNKRKYEKKSKSSASLLNTACVPSTSKTAIVSSNIKIKTTPVTDRKSQRHRLKTILYQSPLPELAFITKLSANEASNSPKPMVNEDKLIVFYKNEYMAVRNAEGTFYLCQTMQNVYRTSPRISIRWLSEDDKNNDVYKPDFYDHTDIDCVLTTVDLKRIDKGHLKLPINEKSRIENILKKAIDVEKGIVPLTELTEENPDGLDLSLYKDESQIEKKSAQSGSGRKSKGNNKFALDINSLSEEHIENDGHTNIDDDGHIHSNKRKRSLKTGRISVTAKKAKRKHNPGKRNKAKSLDSADESYASDDGSGEEYKPKQKKSNIIAVSVSTNSSKNSATTSKSSPRAQRSLLAMARAASPLLSTPTTSRVLNATKATYSEIATTSGNSTSVSRNERATKRKAAVEQNSNGAGTSISNNSKITPTKNKAKENHEVKENNSTANDNDTNINFTATNAAIKDGMTSTTTACSTLSTPTAPNAIDNKIVGETTIQSISGTSSGSCNRPTRSRK